MFWQTIKPGIKQTPGFKKETTGFYHFSLWTFYQIYISDDVIKVSLFLKLLLAAVNVISFTTDIKKCQEASFQGALINVKNS